MNIIYLVILCPLISFLLLLFFSNFLSKELAQKIGIWSIFITMIISFYCLLDFLYQNKRVIFIKKLWTVLSFDNLKINFSFLLDGLSITMLVTITSIGFLIHLFSSWYMQYKDGNVRFFAYMNLFIASMILLILADNLAILYIGWEGVGLCSYLLVGFYYQKIHVCYASMKGFIITRIGDVFLILAIFIIYKNFGTLNFEELKLIFNTSVITEQHIESINYIAFFLLLGSVGKSAQIPLHTWLPDAMVGPTPVSALIHSATMVTAGVYLIARMHYIFLISSEILYYIGIIGSFTLILSCLSALVQTNIKRILAYSTMSQIGYMFLALGMKNWTLAIDHLITHAVFKTLLFLSVGAIIILLNNEQDIFKMGGLKNKFPILYVSCLIGGSSLCSFPVITSGFYSKGAILFSALENNDKLFLISGLLGSLLTSMYIFRMIFLVFFGTQKHILNNTIIFNKSYSNLLPLIVLMIFSTIVFLIVKLPLESSFCIRKISTCHSKLLFEISCSCISLFGIFLSYYFWVINKNFITVLLDTKLGNYLYNFWFNSWGFDYLYNISFVKLYLYVAQLLKSDPINTFMNVPIRICIYLNKKLKYIHNGDIHSYLILILLGCFVSVIINIIIL